MSSEISDRPSTGSPGRWDPRPDGSSPPIRPHFEPIPTERPSVARQQYEMSVRVLNDGTRQQSFLVCNQSFIDEIRAAPLAHIVTITISSATPREDGQPAWLVVERKTFCGSVDRSDWSVLLPGSADKGAAADSAAKEWQKAFDDWAAKKLVEPVTERWDLSGSIADGLGSLQGQYHKLMLGQPVQLASRSVGVPSPAGDLLSDIASEHALPGDSLMTHLKRIGQITVIGVGLASGDLHLAHAGMSSLGKDLATEAVSREFEKLFTPEPQRPRQPAREQHVIYRDPEILREHTHQPNFALHEGCVGGEAMDQQKNHTRGHGRD
jgi:hypothetical protein